MVLYIVSAAVILILSLFLLPFRGRRYERTIPERNIDERDTMFSRNEITPGEKRFDEYYNMRPEHLEPDNTFRSKPGLMREGSSFYNRLAFSAADASFRAVEAFFPMRTDPVEQCPEGKGLPPEQLSLFIKAWMKKMGAHSAGITEMRDYHFYTVAGRKERYGKPVKNKHRYGIALTVEMDYRMTMTGPQEPIVMESARQYLNSGMIATQLALTLRNLGYQATTHIDANYDVICPLVARDAGLGEIGRMGLLMTPMLGPRVRLAVVTTNAPLKTDRSIHDDSVIDFCMHCKKCAHVCPSASIPLGDRKMHEGGLRWQINQEKCFTYWCMAGTDCGRCMAVCPYSHKNNLIHNFVRWGIRNNFFFRRIAIKFDDIIYGRKPKPKPSPGWIG